MLLPLYPSLLFLFLSKNWQLYFLFFYILMIIISINCSIYSQFFHALSYKTNHLIFNFSSPHLCLLPFIRCLFTFKLSRLLTFCFAVVIKSSIQRLTLKVEYNSYDFMNVFSTGLHNVLGFIYFFWFLDHFKEIVFSVQPLFLRSLDC